MSVSGFWTGGQQAALEAIRREYEAKVSQLRAQLAKAGDDAERQRIQVAIEAAHHELKRQEKGLYWASFGSV